MDSNSFKCGTVFSLVDHKVMTDFRGYKKEYLHKKSQEERKVVVTLALWCGLVIMDDVMKWVV